MRGVTKAVVLFDSLRLQLLDRRLSYANDCYAAYAFSESYVFSGGSLQDLCKENEHHAR